jgi:hypothetical protein
MSDAVKGGLFVGAAVMTGLLAGLFVPPLVGAERPAAKRPRAQAALPTMPSIIGQPLDEAQAELRRRGISYETDAPGLVKSVLPQILEVCKTEPGPQALVRGSAHLHAALAGTCDL